MLVLTGKAKPAMPPEDNEQPTADEIATAGGLDRRRRQGPEGPSPIRRCWSRPRSSRWRTVDEAVTAVASVRPTAAAGRGPTTARSNCVACRAIAAAQDSTGIAAA